MWRWVLVACLVGVVAEEEVSCPTHCRCYSDEDNYRAARCKAPAINPRGDQVFPSIQVLNVKPSSRSQSVRLAPHIFQRFRNLKILNLSNCSVIQLPNEVFAGLRYVSDIDLSYNRLRSINGMVFKGLKELQTLLLRGNPLVLNTYSTVYSDSLKELDLGECGLKNIPVETFTNVNTLTHLSLDGNYLQTIHYQSVPNHLKYLNLASNKITNVPTNVLLSLSFLRRIDISDNPVNCTCSLMLMQDWFSGRGVALENDVICHYPKPYRGINLNDINENELCEYEMHQERQMNKLRFSSHKSSHTYHSGSAMNSLPIYEVLMADQPHPIPDDAEVMYSNKDTRALGTHAESKDSTKDSQENIEGSGSEFTEDSAEGKHTTLYDPDESVRESLESTSESTHSSSDIDNTLTTYHGDSGQNSSSIEDENSSKNQSFEIDNPDEEKSSSKETSHTPNQSTTTEEYESSGAGPIIIPETSSKFELIDEREMLSSTTESPDSSSSSTSAVDLSSEHLSNIDMSSPHPSTEGPPTTPGPYESTTEGHVLASFDSEEHQQSSSETPSSSTTEETSPLAEVTEPEIVRKKVVTEGLEHYSELSTEASIANGTDNVVARADTTDDSNLKQSVTTYIIIAVIALPVIILILMAACRRKSPRKVRLPQDTESNLGTELQDMDTLLPKNGGPENGVKVVAKANGAANPADSKSPEEVAPVLEPEAEPEPDVPVMDEPPPSRQNGGAAPIQKTKAKLTILADSIPKTPVFIHKPYPE